MGARGLGRLDDPARVVLVDRVGFGPHVGAIDREARERGAQRLVQLVPRIVAIASPPLADLKEERGQPVQVAAHRLAHHLVLLGARHLGPVGRFTGELGVELGQRLLALRVDEEPGHAVQEVVAGGAVDRPGVAQRLARLEDLLDGDPRLRPGLAQPIQVGLGVAKAVGMVDAEPVQRAVRASAMNASASDPVRSAAVASMMSSDWGETGNTWSWYLIVNATPSRDKRRSPRSSTRP